MNETARMREIHGKIMDAGIPDPCEACQAAAIAHCASIGALFDEWWAEAAAESPGGFERAAMRAAHNVISRAAVAAGGIDAYWVTVMGTMAEMSAMVEVFGEGGEDRPSGLHLVPPGSR
jgi:hypothetical protein